MSINNDQKSNYPVWYSMNLYKKLQVDENA